uniref:Candidate secreted effector n=1 Tax=Meloidogyne incognita TaxID=6306 RepID=A0A914N2Y5_MELIC
MEKPLKFFGKISKKISLLTKTVLHQHTYSNHKNTNNISISIISVHTNLPIMNSF